jgi:predicted lipoprotein
MKADLLRGWLDLAAPVGKRVSVVGAMAPLNPKVITVTPVSVEAGS